MSFILTLVYYYCYLNSNFHSHKTKTLQDIQLKKTMLVMCKKNISQISKCHCKNIKFHGIILYCSHSKENR
jgi:hypothetical protein